MRVGVGVGVVSIILTNSQSFAPTLSIAQFNIPTSVDVGVGLGIAHGGTEYPYPS